MSRNFLAFAKNLSNLPHETAPDSPDGPQPEAGVVPKVVEKTNRGERSYDIFSRLLKERIVMIGTPVNQKVANLIVAQLIYLSHQNDEKDIHVYINSPGGQIYSGLAIYDTMQHIEAPISTTCVGLAASLGSVLLTGGTRGKRRALPNSRMMIHQPLGGTRGQASDIEIQAEEMANIKDRLVDILSYHTDQDPATIRDDFDRDFFLDAYEAQEYGLIDEVIERHDPAVTPPSAEE